MLQIKWSLCCLIICLSSIWADIGKLAVVKSNSLNLNKKQRESCDYLIPFANNCDNSYENIDNFCDKWSARIDKSCDRYFDHLKRNCNKSEKKIKDFCQKKYGYMTSACGKRLDNLERVCKVTSNAYSNRCTAKYRKMDNTCYRKYMNIDRKCRKIYDRYEDYCESDLRHNYWDKTKFVSGQFDIDIKKVQLKKLAEFSDINTNVEELKEKILKNKVSEKTKSIYNDDLDNKFVDFEKAVKKPIITTTTTTTTKPKKPVIKEFLDDFEFDIKAIAKVTPKPTNKPAIVKKPMAKGLIFDIGTDEEIKGIPAAAATKITTKKTVKKPFKKSLFEEEEFDIKKRSVADDEYLNKLEENTKDMVNGVIGKFDNVDEY